MATYLPNAASAETQCRQGLDARVWTAPLEPLPGQALKVMAVAAGSKIEQLIVTDPEGRQSRLPAVRGGGPPWSLRGILPHPTAGTYRIEATRGGHVVTCAEVTPGIGDRDRGGAEWDLAHEALYAAWIEHLFDAPPEQSLSFPSLAPVLRDPDRNFLYGYLDREEDRQVPAEPDCADLPYFLRAYFAWKLGLPISYRACSRGSRHSPPRCEAPRIDNSFTRSPAPARQFRELSREIMNKVHSGCGRTALEDDASDFYPIPLERWTLWPGTLYADPYGHTLILVKWVPQTFDRSGLLLAVDAQPDNSVTRKRFWEGNFLFASTPSAGAGFKAYRAPVGTGSKGPVRPLPNSALDGGDGLPPYSTEQANLTPEDFYARMQQLINPRGLDPESAYSATLESLMEQLEARVKSVDNGERYMRTHKGTVPMPLGPAIFETTGPWEDYSTPSRDMRLLIAMKVLENLPGRIRRYPELFVLRGENPSAAGSRIEQLHERRIRERSIRYTRSDGSNWNLSLKEIYARRPGLQIAYNPNDCVERRWGASLGTPEYATCSRQAPSEQRARMEKYRPWFRETRRPPR
ncbi:MAG: hypothetical protein LJE70_18970 [Chromatiaceae bacterium]|nr:hypothetical protein [Chromatiaceae bacterium]